MKDAGMILGAIILGAAIGVAAGILLAPEKGSETRQKISDTTKDLANRLRKIKNGHLNGNVELDEYETLLGL